MTKKQKGKQENKKSAKIEIAAEFIKFSKQEIKIGKGLSINQIRVLAIEKVYGESAPFHPKVLKILFGK